MLLALLLIFNSSSVWAGCPDDPTTFTEKILSHVGPLEGPLRRLAATVLNPVLAFTLRATCKTYIPHSSRLSQCESAAGSLVNNLDSRGFLPVCFSSNLDEFLASPNVGTYLHSLVTDIRAARANRDEFNLWTYTLAHAGGNREKALSWIGTLFQFKASGVITYNVEMHNKGKGLYVTDFDAAIAEVYSHENAKAKIETLPPGIHSNDTDVYHFYVNAYLAEKLSKTPDVSKTDVVFLPLIFNTTYEYNKMGDRGKWGGFMHYGEPKKIDQKAYDPELESAYLGYAGALFGAGESASIMEREKFISEFSSSPHAFIKSFSQ